MSLSNELSDYSFPQVPIMSLSWMSHSPPQSSRDFRLLGPQIVPYSSPKLHGGPPATTCDVQSSGSQSPKRRSNNRKVSKNNYKHIPHKDKPPHLVARRNARERKRVQAVNSAFAKLRKSVPVENRNKRLSKVKTLHRAIEYINGLQALLHQSDNPSALPSNPLHYTHHHSESNTSHEDDELEDDEREMGDFNEFEEYLESDIEVVNKENESRGWTVSSGCETNYWSCVPYGECVGNMQN